MQNFEIPPASIQRGAYPCFQAPVFTSTSIIFIVKHASPTTQYIILLNIITDCIYIVLFYLKILKALHSEGESH